MQKLTRRDFVKTTAMSAAAIAAYKASMLQAMAAVVSPQLSKWTETLRGLNAGVAGSAALGDVNGIPVLNSIVDPVFTSARFFQVTAGEFTDKLHTSLGPTKLWGYWDTTNPVKRHLGGVVIATRGTASRIRFTNTLPTPHIIPTDITIPGANQAQNRIAIHLHGGWVPWISDGGPFDWWTPGGGAVGLSFLNGPGSVLDNILVGNATFPLGLPIQAGQADYFYPNDQSTRLSWYHDHAHGITRINAYAGLATGFLIIDPTQESSLAAKVPSLMSTVPLVWQDKKFVDPATIGLTDPTWATVARPDVQSLGSLWYQHVYDPKEFRLLKSTKNLPLPNPSAIPEFFGDTMLCNGTVYPKLTLDPKPYRFFMLNACNARFLNINTFVADATLDGITLNPKTLFPNNLPGPTMVQIGTEGGYLFQQVDHVSPKPFNPALLTGNLLLGCAERADVIVDFTAFAGKDIILYNDAPGPFPAGPPITDYFIGNTKNPAMVGVLAGNGPDTRQILRISVNLTQTTPSEPPPAPGILAGITMDPPAIVTYPNNIPAGGPVPVLAVPAGTPIRDLTLNEDFDLYGRLRQTLGTTTPGILPGFGREYLEPATEIVTAGSTEAWRIFNITADTHPIHFHLVNVQVLSRQPFRIINGVFTPTGAARGPELNELGWKETVQMHPGEVTTVIMKFDLPTVPFNVPSSARDMGLPPGTPQNEYVWHCHILEHEEHDMMRPLIVVNQNQLVVTPSNINIVGKVGGVAQYTIGGGTPPYSVNIPNPNFVPVLINNGFTVTVKNNTAPVTVIYTVTDANLATAQVTLNVI